MHIIFFSETTCRCNDWQYFFADMLWQWFAVINEQVETVQTFVENFCCEQRRIEIFLGERNWVSPSILDRNAVRVNKTNHWSQRRVACVSLASFSSKVPGCLHLQVIVFSSMQVIHFPVPSFCFPPTFDFEPLMSQSKNTFQGLCKFWLSWFLQGTKKTQSETLSQSQVFLHLLLK